MGVENVQTERMFVERVFGLVDGVGVDGDGVGVGVGVGVGGPLRSRFVRRAAGEQP